jgi:hypothetical protein
MMRTGLLVLLCLAFVAFVAGNWGAFTTSTVLTLGVVDFTAPLGLLMLIALTLVAVGFLSVMALWQGRVLSDSRRHARELAEHRSIAENAEASRLTALRAQIAADLTRLEARIDAAEGGLRNDLHEGINSLAAMVGEMDDRLAASAPIDVAREPPPPGSRH